MTPTQKDFEAVAQAAIIAFTKGDEKLANQLDLIARKFNAEITSRGSTAAGYNWGIRSIRTSFTWRDVPSVLEFARPGSSPTGGGSSKGGRRE